MASVVVDIYGGRERDRETEREERERRERERVAQRVAGMETEGGEQGIGTSVSNFLGDTKA